MADSPWIQAQAPANPLQVLSGWQDLANKQQLNKNMKLANQTGQQDLGQKMAMRHAQIMFGLSNLPDDQLPAAAAKALQDELQSGQIDEQRYSVMKQQLDSAGGDSTKIRPMINSGLISNLSGPEAIKAVMGDQGAYNAGPNTIFYGRSGQLGQNPGQMTPQAVIQNLPGPQMTDLGPSIVPTSGGAPIGAPLTKGIGPQMTDLGGGVQPTNNGQATGPVLPYTLSPGQAVQQQSRMVQGPDGKWVVQTSQLGQANPNLAPPGMRTGGTLGSGAYPGPPQTNVPVGAPEQQQKQQGNDLEQFQTDAQRVPALTTGVQSLNKALGALQQVATGAGTEGLARMRSFAVSLGNVLGVDTGGVNVQDMNRAQLEKYLTDYARSSGTAGRSDAGLEAAFKSNASGSINNSAAQDVVRTNIGRDRMSIAFAQDAPDKTGVGYSQFKANQVNKYDPRGFAWDTYTPEQRQQIIKETQGKQGDKSPEFRKLATAIGTAQRLGLLDSNMLAGAPPHAAFPSPLPGPQTQTPPATPPNTLQAPQQQQGPVNFLNPGYKPGT